nr:hypothetical protein [uncultured Ruminococcus sp.]
MRKSQKAIIVSLLLAVIAAMTISPTLSWLSDTSDSVVNTFAGGAISIKLDEALVDTNGKTVEGDNAQRVLENSYKYIPGAVLDKDPTVTVLKGSEECYVFMCVDNELNDLFTINYDTTSWLKVASNGNKTVYIYKSSINALMTDNDVVLNPIFTTITVSQDLTSQDVEKIGQKTVTATAYAVQAANIEKNEAINLAIEQFLPAEKN